MSMLAPSRLVPTVVVAVLVSMTPLVVATASAAPTAETARAARHRHSHPVPHRTRQVAPRPRRSYAMPPGSYFSYPNRSKKERRAIRNRVLLTIRSVWGGRRNSLGTPMPTNGTIRIATWSFEDWAVAKALVAARNRGVSVQVVAAAGKNKKSRAWRYLRKHLGSRLYRPGHRVTAPMYSFARRCKGSCRGPGGTPHAKYFLFDNVGSRHVRNVVVQTSMNLTDFAYTNQWNQAQVVWSRSVHADFARVFAQARRARPVNPPYHVYATGNVVDLFFPRPGATAAGDPVMQLLNRVGCTGAAAGGTRSGRTRIRIIQYAIYGQRGTWIAKKLRYLWDHGCDLGIIYSISSRPVLSILRSRSGRGPVPMRQSVIKNDQGEIVKYNHSKWMTITGHWGSSRAEYLTLAGSANWANLAFSSDEQMQRISGARTAHGYLAAYAKTWRQRTSAAPAFGRVLGAGRMLPAPLPDDAPAGAPAFGTGVYRYLTRD